MPAASSGEGGRSDATEADSAGPEGSEDDPPPACREREGSTELKERREGAVRPFHGRGVYEHAGPVLLFFLKRAHENIVNLLVPNTRGDLGTIELAHVEYVGDAHPFRVNLRQRDRKPEFVQCTSQPV